ncbi:hypothetical protein FB451DRAFT_98317 [Mycena latifolia]|nr:hypothetical protein FB451DRAFT_98317 [Mycena latifolia]
MRAVASRQFTTLSFCPSRHFAQRWYLSRTTVRQGVYRWLRRRQGQHTFFMFMGAASDSVGTPCLSLWLDNSFGPLVTIAEDRLNDQPADVNGAPPAIPGNKRGVDSADLQPRPASSKRPKARFARAMRSMKSIRTLQGERTEAVSSNPMPWANSVLPAVENEDNSVTVSGVESWGASIDLITPGSSWHASCYGDPVVGGIKRTVVLSQIQEHRPIRSQRCLQRVLSGPSVFP